MRSSGKWPANLTHCIYGLDANIVMLALACQEPHMYLLRELVSYGKGSRGPAAREMLESSLEDEFVLCRMGYDIQQFLSMAVYGCQEIRPFAVPHAPYIFHMADLYLPSLKLMQGSFRAFGFSLNTLLKSYIIEYICELVFAQLLDND